MTTDKSSIDAQLQGLYSVYLWCLKLNYMKEAKWCNEALKHMTELREENAKFRQEKQINIPSDKRDDNERLRDDNDRFRENELLLSKDGKTWRSAFDIIKEMNAENEKLREALKIFVSKEPIQLTYDGRDFVQAVIVFESDLVMARAALEGVTGA